VIEDPGLGPITILADSKTSFENIMRLLSNRKNLQFFVKEEDGYTVTIIRA
jgi:hypothetical protein